MRQLPFYKENMNAFLSKKKLSFKKHFLKNGTKKLLYEISLPNGVTLFFSHFSLSKKVRKKQFKEVREILLEQDSKIICGDFNVGDTEEVSWLMKNSKMDFVQTTPTFPAYCPKKTYDLLLHTRGLSIKAKVLKAQISDHLPLIK